MDTADCTEGNCGGTSSEFNLVLGAIVPMAAGALIASAWGKDKMQIGAGVGLAVGLFMPAVMTKVYNRLNIG